jgi:hypothetical protein
MRKLAIAAFLVSAILASASTTATKAAPTAPVLTFDQSYMFQVDKSNTALQAFWVADCGDPTLRQKAQTLKKETVALHELFVKISDSGEPLKTQFIEMEIGLGFIDTVTEAVKQQNECTVKPESNPAPVTGNTL